MSEPQSITKELLDAQRNPSELLAEFVGPEKVYALRDLANLSREVVSYSIRSGSNNISRGEAKTIRTVKEQISAIEALLESSDGQVTQAAANQVGERFFVGLVSLSNGTDQFDERIDHLRDQLDSFRIAISNSRNTGSDFSNLTSPENINPRQQEPEWLREATANIPSQILE